VALTYQAKNIFLTLSMLKTQSKKDSKNENNSSSIGVISDKNSSVNSLETLQEKADSSNKVKQLQSTESKMNSTGLPDNLKAGIENLSGYSLDDVKVHRNSDKPAQLQAHAYAQGSDIHLGPGQEKHLPHEAWHVVQQKQGRVKPTMQMKEKVNINDDSVLEKEADVMGEKANRSSQEENEVNPLSKITTSSTVQRALESQSAMTGGLSIKERKAQLALAGLTDGGKISASIGVPAVTVEKEEAPAEEKEAEEAPAEEKEAEESKSEEAPDEEATVEEAPVEIEAKEAPSDIDDPVVKTLSDNTDDKGVLTTVEGDEIDKSKVTAQEAAALTKDGTKAKSAMKDGTQAMNKIKTLIDPDKTDFTNPEKNADNLWGNTDSVVSKVLGPAVNTLAEVIMNLVMPVKTIGMGAMEFMGKLSQKSVFKSFTQIDRAEAGPKEIAEIADYALGKIWKGFIRIVYKITKGIIKLSKGIAALVPGGQALAGMIELGEGIVKVAEKAGSAVKKWWQSFKGEKKITYSNKLLDKAINGDKDAARFILELKLPSIQGSSIEFINWLKAKFEGAQEKVYKFLADKLGINMEMAHTVYNNLGHTPKDEDELIKTLKAVCDEKKSKELISKELQTTMTGFGV